MYYLYNGHGDVTGLADTTGNITKTYNYDAFGVELNPDLEDTNPFRYCGEYYDKETNSIYLRARYYNLVLGRFITEDPVKDGLNWYAYCENSPIIFIDPLGLEYLVVSGGAYKENDSWPYEFIEPAIKKINEMREYNDSETITWIIADEGWNSTTKQKFEEAVEGLNVNIIYIKDKKELIDYINVKNGGESRKNDKITKFAVFSHGFLDGTVSLGYNYNDNTYNTKLDLRKSDIEYIKESSFDNPNSVFYSCNTGTGNYSFAQM